MRVKLGARTTEWLSGWETKLEDFTQENSQYCSQGSQPEPLRRTRTPRSQALQNGISPADAFISSLALRTTLSRGQSGPQQCGKRWGGGELWEQSSCRQAATGDTGQQPANCLVLTVRLHSICLFLVAWEESGPIIRGTWTTCEWSASFTREQGGHWRFGRWS